MAKKGHKTWNKGIPWSDEIKRKMSEVKKKKGKSNGADNPFYGKKHSLETRQKWSLLRKGKTPWNKGKKLGYTPGRAFKKGDNIGNKNPAWKGGITPINLKIRNSLDYELWRKAVYERDNYVCRKCKIRGGKLHAHHIQNFSQFPELRLAIDNGITFCVDCHRLFHKIFGKNNNNYQQIIEFLK